MSKLKELIIAHKFVKLITYNYEQALSYAIAELMNDFAILPVSDKPTLFQKLNSEIYNAPTLCVSTALSDMIADNEVVNLYFPKYKKNNIYWIDINTVFSHKPTYFLHEVHHLDVLHDSLSDLDIIYKIKTLGLSAYLQVIQLPSEFKIVLNKQYKSFLDKSLNKSTVLLTGVSGIGKSYLAKYTAYKWNIPLVRLNFNALLSRYFGEAEKHFDKILNSLHLLTPCVLWIEEIDKLFISYQTESTGSIARLLADLLFFMQEKTINNLHIIATANNINKIPKELLRRFQYEFHIQLPQEDAIRELCELYQYQTNGIKALVGKTYDEIIKIINN